MASFIDEVLGRLFPKKHVPVNIKENFTQSAEEQKSIDKWMTSLEYKELLGLVSKNYYFKKSNINAQPEIHLLNSPYANGFAVSFDAPLTEETFTKLFFAFGKKILELGYRQVSLDRKFEEINEQVRCTEKQYFKPPLSSADLHQKIDQLYGNVSVEKITIDNKPSYLKVLVTVYSDHLYLKARPFEGFVDHLLETDS